MFRFSESQLGKLVITAVKKSKEGGEKSGYHLTAFNLFAKSKHIRLRCFVAKTAKVRYLTVFMLLNLKLKHLVISL